MFFQDYHLAKRYYDLAAETSGEAHVPVVLALMRLDLQYYYDSYVEVQNIYMYMQILHLWFRYKLDIAGSNSIQGSFPFVLP